MKVEIYGKIRECSGGFHSWVRSSVGIIRKPNNYKAIYGKTNQETKTQTIGTLEEEIKLKVGEIKKQTNMKKLLLVLNAENKWHRLIRRGIVIGFLTAVALIIKEGLMPVASDSYVVLFTAILAFLDKAIREFTKE